MSACGYFCTLIALANRGILGGFQQVPGVANIEETILGVNHSITKASNGREVQSHI